MAASAGAAPSPRLTAVVINLASRSDRWAQACADWAPLGVMLKRLDAVALPSDPARGCLCSHIMALRLLASSPVHVSAILVLEDDATPTPDFATHIDGVLADAACTPGWLVLNLGPNLRPMGTTPLARVPGARNLLSASAAYTTHALVYSRRATALLPVLNAAATAPGPVHPIDVLLSDRTVCGSGGIIVPTRALVAQRAGWSDIERREVAYGSVMVREFNERAAIALQQ